MAKGSNGGTQTPSHSVQRIVDKNEIIENKINASKVQKYEDLLNDASATLPDADRHHPQHRRHAPWTSHSFWNTTTAVIPAWTGPCLKAVLTITVALYILNQKHLLPKPLSAVVSDVLFWPTLPITASRRMGRWITKVDDTVIMGGAPFGFLSLPEKLYHDYKVRTCDLPLKRCSQQLTQALRYIQVRGVVNLCQEYAGPVDKYKKLGMKHLRLPTVDHFEPSTDDLEVRRLL
jgi:atypical dual specificity phosphatase